MKKVKKRLRNLLLQGSKTIIVFFFLPLLSSSQIANYVNNGGFEEQYDCNFPNELNKTKGWNSIGFDTSKFGGFVYSASCYSNVPYDPGVSFQFPRSGNSYYRLQSFCNNPCPIDLSRAYPKNRLKGNLVSGKTYCVKMYVNLQNTSPYAIKDLSIYFGNNTIDTINYANRPLTYINPQITNVSNNFFIDTLNWTPFTSTYTANGSEKYLVIGDFLSDVATTRTLVIPTATEDWAEYMIDDVSCIPLDLPAFAGPDVFCIPGNSVYIGRPSDVGIDEACMWYKLPNTTTAIDTAAGLWVTPTGTSTYVVKQDICGVVKWDTVVVMQSGVGVSEIEQLKDKLSIYPIPGSDEIFLRFEADINDRFKSLIIYNSLGQILREEEVVFKNNKLTVKTNDLPIGVYTFKLLSNDHFEISKRFVIAR